MGYYVNPPGQDKFEWLVKHGERSEPVLPTDDKLGLVCLVYNQFFSAAGICYSDRELEEFTDPDDMRPKDWFVVPKEELMKVAPKPPGW